MHTCFLHVLDEAGVVDVPQPVGVTPPDLNLVCEDLRLHQVSPS